MLPGVGPVTPLDLADIQGNICRPYGRFGFPFARHIFFRIHTAEAGRRFVEALWPNVTTAAEWPTIRRADGSEVVDKPDITLNIGFSYQGLRALDLPTRTLRLMPDEFIDGMHCRAEILGDVGASAPRHWNKAWREADSAHVWVSMNVGMTPDGEPLPVLGDWTDRLLGFVEASEGGVSLLTGHGGDGRGRWQDSRALMTRLRDGTPVPCAREPFGFTDAISDPVFRGQFDPAAEALAAKGGGKIADGPYHEDTSWAALETGEFILGHPDEGQELPVVTQPAAFARNGAFMVWRKLEQDVDAFEAYIAEQAEVWMHVNGTDDREEAEETLRAKMVGRWRSGIPLMNAPTWREHQALIAAYEDCIELTLREPRDSHEAQRLAEFNKLLTCFRYGDDLEGARCPLGAHIRRANPRDMLDPYADQTHGCSTLTNRRRILRRALPYVDKHSGEQGMIFMAICASIFRQFEFIQQQWMNYGLDFDAGNDADPLIGNRADEGDKFVIPASKDHAAFIAPALPQFVTTRGGEYFFLPGLNAIRMIAMGTIDPT